MICQFRRIFQKVSNLTFVNSRITVPKFTNFSHGVLESSLMLTRILALQYSNALWNASAKNEGGISQVYFPPKNLLVIIAMSLGWPQNECQIYYPQPYIYQSWKFGEDWPSNFWYIWRDMPIFGIFSTQLRGWETRFPGLLNQSSPNLHTM